MKFEYHESTIPKNDGEAWEFNILDPALAPEDRDKIFMQDATLSAFYYISALDSLSTDPARPYGMGLPEAEAQRAFYCGYVCALHKGRIFDNALSPYRKNHLKYLNEEFRKKLEKYSFPTITGGVALYLQISQHLQKHSSNNSESPMTASIEFVQEMFLTGYQAAFLFHDKYDRCLFMQDHTLKTEVLGAMIAFRESEENARRASARIVLQMAHKPNKNILRAILRFSQDSIDDAGLSPTPSDDTH